MNIRLAKSSDLDAIQDVVSSAFSDDERHLIIALVAGLFSESTCPAIRSLVLQQDGQIVGYVSFSPIFTRLTPAVSGYILAPLAVSPVHQKQGIGAKLIKSGIEMLGNDGGEVLLVYGNPAYYGRFGFTSETAKAFLPPYPVAYPAAWQGLMINAGAPPQTMTGSDCVQPLNNAALW